MTERFRPYCAVYLILENSENQLLMMRRFQTGFRDGEYNLPSGHVEEGETPTKAIIREAKEEINAELNTNDVSLVHTSFRNNQQGRTYISFYFKAITNQLNIKNNEPDKCDDLQ